MPEYETIAMCGPSCRIDDREAIIRFNDICNAYGLDTISVGAAVAFAMECYEHGILTRDDLGMELRWGDGEAMVALTEMMARREGVGAALADGVVQAAKQFGRGAEAYAVHAGGQEIPAHDPRCYPSLALTYRLDPTPGRHSRGGSSWIAGHGPIGDAARQVRLRGHRRVASARHLDVPRDGVASATACSPTPRRRRPSSPSS